MESKTESSPLTFATLRAINAERNVASFPGCADWTNADWGCALAGEVGEACNLIKRSMLTDIDPREIGKELADVVIYADLLATRMGFCLEDLISTKFNEVSARIGSDLRLPVRGGVR